MSFKRAAIRRAIAKKVGLPKDKRPRKERRAQAIEMRRMLYPQAKEEVAKEEARRNATKLGLVVPRSQLVMPDGRPIRRRN